MIFLIVPAFRWAHNFQAKHKWSNKYREVCQWCRRVFWQFFGCTSLTVNISLMNFEIKLFRKRNNYSYYICTVWSVNDSAFRDPSVSGKIDWILRRITKFVLCSQSPLNLHHFHFTKGSQKTPNYSAILECHLTVFCIYPIVVYFVNRLEIPLFYTYFAKV